MKPAHSLFAFVAVCAVVFLAAKLQHKEAEIRTVQAQYHYVKHRADSLDLQCRAYVYGMKRTAESLNNYGVFLVFATMKEQALMYARNGEVPIVVEPYLTLQDIKHKDQ